MSAPTTSASPEVRFLSYPEAIAEVTSLLAPGDNRRSLSLTDLGLLLRSQHIGEVRLSRPLFVIEE